MTGTTRCSHDDIARLFGVERLEDWQAEAIDAACSGRDTVVLAPTGSGKSLVYLVAGRCAGGWTLVVSPLLALQSDQQAHAEEAEGVRAECLDGSVRSRRRQALLDDVDQVVAPALTHWQHPGFYGYFPCNSSPPAVLGELLSAGLGTQGMLWSTGPACTELEIHVLDWLVDLCGLPDRFRSDGPGGGVIQDSASSATLCAILAARDRAGGAPAIANLVAYTSIQAHSSVEKGVRIAGFEAGQLRAIAADADHAMDPVALAEAVAADRAAGLVPCIVVGTVGTTSSGAVDPLPAIAEVAAEAGFPGAHRAVGRFLRDHSGHPWWRVVTSNGRLVPGLEAEQARRLGDEGVAVRDGRVRPA